MGCCGGSGWQDYANYNMEIPYECRNQVTGNMYVYGCGIIFADYVEPLIGWMSGLALLLVVLQVYINSLIKSAVKSIPDVIFVFRFSP